MFTQAKDQGQRILDGEYVTVFKAPWELEFHRHSDGDIRMTAIRHEPDMSVHLNVTLMTFNKILQISSLSSSIEGLLDQISSI